MSKSFSISSFDALGTTIGIRYNGFNRTRTGIGGFMTILIFIISIVTIFFFGTQYLNGKEIKMMNNIIKYWNSQEIPLNEEFIIGISTIFDGKKEFKEKIFKISADFITFNTTSYEMGVRKLEISYCSEKDWKEESKSQFNQMKLSSSLCVKPYNSVIKGNFNSEIYDYIRVIFDINLTLTQEESSQLETSIPIASIHILEGLSYFKEDNSLVNTYFINSYNVNATFGDMKNIEISISKDELIINEDNLFYSNSNLISNYVIQDVREKISVRPPSISSSLSFIIQSSNKKNVTYISFMTFSEMLARIGAIIQNLLMVFTVTNYFVSYWNCDKDKFNDILNKIYSDMKRISPNQKLFLRRTVDKSSKLIQNNSQNSQNNSQNNIKEQDISNSNLNINYLNKYDSQNSQNSHNNQHRESNIINSLSISLSKSHSGISPIINHQQELKRLEKKSITIEVIKELINEVNSQGLVEFSFCNYIYYKYFSSNILFRFINNYYSKSMEVNNIESLYFQFHILKYVMLNKEQLHLFENIPFLNGVNIIKDVNEERQDKLKVFTLSDDHYFNRKIASVYNYVTTK